MQVLGKDQLTFELDLGMKTKLGKCADLGASASKAVFWSILAS